MAYPHSIAFGLFKVPAVSQLIEDNVNATTNNVICEGALCHVSLQAMGRLECTCLISYQDKKKYEIANGQWKTSAELIALYGSLLLSYPGLIGFIDPLHPKVNNKMYREKKIQ